MTKLASLGFIDSFSVNAASRYKASNAEIDEIEYFSSIKSVFNAVGTTCDYGIVPIENLVEGHIVQVLELLLQSNIAIIGELVVPITYRCITTANSLSTINTIFTSYNSRSECSEFIAQHPDCLLTQVSDAGSAIDKILHDDTAAAIIPSWAADDNRFDYTLPNVNDYPGNTTRYIVLGEQEQAYEPDKKYKTSFVLLETADRPGMLSGILAAFSSRSINLTSILSRPTREHLGTYHFFIDCIGYVFSPEFRSAFEEIKVWCRIKLLGSYSIDSFTPSSEDTPLPDAIPSMTKNPLRSPSKKPRITIAAGHGPYRNTLDAMANFNLSPVQGKRVLLKPNIGRIAEPYSGVVTNPQVVAAAIDAFKAAGADVAVGESPITGVNMETAFNKSGVEFIARERNCPLIDMDKRPPVEIAVTDGDAIKKLKICADIFDFDFIVSMPVMKTHMHAGVTLSIKNMKGCLWRRSKVDLHMLPRIPFSDEKSLDIAICDVGLVLRPHLVIIDGTVGMEGLGPSSGEPKPLDLVIIGDDAFSADCVACTIMGIDPSTVPHLKIASKKGLGSLDPDSYHVTNPDWHSLCQPFAPVPQNLAIQFPKVTILDEQSCSACQSTVLLFMKRYAEQLYEYFPDSKQITIAIGKGHKGVPPNTLCIGNCTRRFRDAGVYVPGCPPVASNIASELEKHHQQKP